MLCHDSTLLAETVPAGSTYTRFYTTAVAFSAKDLVIGEA